MGIANVVDTDLDVLTELNLGYVRSVQESDVAWFAEMLAEDFLCSSSDGSLLDRAAFLDHTGHPVSISGVEAHDVNVRLFGDLAIIHARTTFRHADGSAGASRYTDIWQKRDGRWLAIAAQVTRYEP